MQLTQKIRIEPTYAQEIVIQALSEKCRLIYNFALKERKEAFEKGIKRINYRKQQDDLPKIKLKYPEYDWVYSKVLQHTLRTLNADFRSFFALWKKGDKEAKPPKFKGKKFFTTMMHNQSGFKLGKGWMELSHKHPTGTKLRFNIPEKFSFSKVCQVTIYKKDKQYFLSVVYEIKEPKFVDNGMYQAFDLGVTKHTAINIQGKFKEFKIARPDKYWKNPITELQSRKDHCKKNSNKFKKLNILLSKCKRKCSNQIKDFQHKLSHKIVTNTKANTIIVGDLSVKKMCKTNKYQKGLHYSLHNTGWISRLVWFLTYKAKRIGKRTVETSERKTSKRCCICGKEQDMPLYKRQYVCDCGNIIDRDRNSSINIMSYFLSQNGLCTAYSNFLGNLRQTGLAIVAKYSQEAPCES